MQKKSYFILAILCIVIYFEIYEFNEILIYENFNIIENVEEGKLKYYNVAMQNERFVKELVKYNRFERNNGDAVNFLEQHQFDLFCSPNPSIQKLDEYKLTVFQNAFPEEDDEEEDEKDYISYRILYGNAVIGNEHKVERTFGRFKIEVFNPNGNESSFVDASYWKHPFKNNNYVYGWLKFKLPKKLNEDKKDDDNLMYRIYENNIIKSSPRMKICSNDKIEKVDKKALAGVCTMIYNEAPRVIIIIIIIDIK